jgi:hypothetical protein
MRRAECRERVDPPYSGVRARRSGIGAQAPSDKQQRKGRLATPTRERGNVSYGLTRPTWECRT